MVHPNSKDLWESTMLIHRIPSFIFREVSWIPEGFIVALEDDEAAEIIEYFMYLKENQNIFL
jgi:hypothetical protein